MLIAVPVTFAQANAFVTAYHRHHKAVAGHKFSIGVSYFGVLVGVVMVGRPVSRHRDDGKTLEITRLCTDGTPNACSFLYGRAYRAAKALGYSRLGTYHRADEPGTSAVAAGFVEVGKTKIESWDRGARPRVDKTEVVRRTLFEVSL